MFLHWDYSQRSYDQLERQSRPASADQPESFNAVLYDTQQYAAGGSSRLTFFSSTAASLSDLTLSNFADGRLGPGEYFEVHRIFTYIMAIPSVGTGAVASSANDIEILHKTARGTFLLEMKGKRFLPVPLSYAGAAGGGEHFVIGTLTAPAHIAYPNQSKNGGFPVLGSVVLAPLTKVTGFLDFNSTAVSAAVNVRLELAGTLHRNLA
jgi:hypothetical protein